MKLTAVILAGGKSSRFGRDKTQLELDGNNIVARLVELCRQFSDDIVIVSNAEDKFSLPDTREISDNFTGMGPLGGIEAGLGAARNSAALVMAADMPLVNSGLLRCLIESFAAADCDILLPVLNDYPEPLCGIYKSDLAALAAECLMDGRRAVKNLSKLAKTALVAEEIWRAAVGNAEVFFNLNMPQDEERLRKLLADEES